MHLQFLEQLGAEAKDAAPALIALVIGENADETNAKPQIRVGPLRSGCQLTRTILAMRKDFAPLL